MENSLSQDRYRTVDILGVRFPRMTQYQLLDRLLQRVGSGPGGGICFPDMSTMNLVVRDAEFRALLNDRMEVYNDGAGLAWAARRQGLPFPDNLNGTDLVPLLLKNVPEGTRVYVIGARDDILQAAVTAMARVFPKLDFVGCHHGYLQDEEEQYLIREIQGLRPDIVLVAMGNPRQIHFIARARERFGFDHTVFLAVGGLLHYFAGDLRRAPVWLRKMRLEWLFITIQQPHKWKRYFVGIPRFLLNVLLWERNHGKPVSD